MVEIRNAGHEWLSVPYLPQVRSGIGFSLQGEMRAGGRLLPALGSRTLLSQQGDLQLSPGLLNYSIRFRPGVVFLPEKMSAREFQQEKAAALDDLWSGTETVWTSETPEQILESLCRYIARLQGEKKLLEPASLLPLPGASQRVSDWAKNLGLSERSLERRIDQLLGISPKNYLDLLRFRRVLESWQQNRNEDLLGIALDAGYFDQSHFIHSFRKYSGQSPEAWRRNHQLSDFYNTRS
jgi:AraC-like DNA-binding protein